MSDDLSDLLEAYSSSVVLAMATFQGVAPKGSKLKGPIIATLAKLLPERDRVLAQWQALGKAERALAEGILRRGGQARARTLQEELMRQGLVDKSAAPTLDIYRRPRQADPRAEKSRHFDDVLARLMLRGLVYASAADELESPRAAMQGYEPPKTDFLHLPDRVIIPESIRRHLPQLPPPERALRPAKVAAVNKSSARVFQRDLYLYWSYVRDHPVYLTQKDEAAKSDLKKINASLLVRETLGKGEGELSRPRLRFVRQMLMALDLVGISEAGLLEADKTPRDFFAQAPAERVKRTFEAWRQSIYFNELLLLPREARPQRVEETLLTAPDLVMRARQTVVEAVQTLVKTVKADDWLALGALADYLREEDYEFLFPRLPARGGYYAYMPQHPYTAATNPLNLEFADIGNEEEGWNLVEANFIQGVVAGPLFWMGLAEVGWGKEGEPESAPEAFRLTALGAWALGLGPRPEIQSEGGRVIVQPNMHIVALDPVNDATLAALDHFAERLTAERAVEYQLTRASVYAGQLADWDAARIKAFLRDQTGADLPANVARTLDEWQTQHERIVLRPKVALAHGPASLFDAAAEAAALGAGRPLPEVLLLKGSKAVPGFVAALRAQGVLPLVSERPAVPANAVQADENGALRFLARRPSLYLHGHLAAFADPDGASGYQVTAETVARAARAGLSAPEIIIRLAAVHRGPVPEKLMRRIRAWAKHYGDAALQEVILLQVRDAATLAELQADPELAPLLQDFAPKSPEALACVRPADVELLRARLAERGIDLDSQIV